jgi:hypothetical protein
VYDSNNEAAKAVVINSWQAIDLPCQVKVAAGSATCSNCWRLEIIKIFSLNVRLDTGRFKRLLITGVFPMLR